VLNWFIRSDIRVHLYPSEKMILNPLSSEEPKLSEKYYCLIVSYLIGTILPPYFSKLKGVWAIQ
jgi:hypothetical protein